MPVNREQWAERVTAIPSWPCPTCQRGQLRSDAQVNVITAETGVSKRRRDDDAWDPDWIVSRFVTMVRCDDIRCGEVVAVSGTTRVVEGDFDYKNGDQHYFNEYEIEATVPAPVPIVLHKQVPLEVAELLAAAAPHLWSDPEAAANKIRQAVEAFLTDQGVVRFTKGQKGKRVALSLHDRIVRYRKTQPDLADHLLAVKWIGNAGSHVGGVERDTLFDVLDIMEVVLDDAYLKTRANVKKKVTQIIKSRGKRTTKSPQSSLKPSA